MIFNKISLQAHMKIFTPEQNTYIIRRIDSQLRNNFEHHIVVILFYCTY